MQMFSIQKMLLISALVKQQVFIVFFLFFFYETFKIFLKNHWQVNK